MMLGRLKGALGSSVRARRAERRVIAVEELGMRTVPFWRMATTPVAELSARAAAISAAVGVGEVVPMDSVPGAGSLPGVTIASAGIGVDGDHLRALRAGTPPIIARVRDGHTLLDLRTVDPADDVVVAAALRSLPGC